MATSRLRLKDMMESRLPLVAGECAGNVAALAKWVNSAQESLLYCREMSDTGFWGAWAELVYDVDRDNPLITLPRGVARPIGINACTYPIAIQNGFYEYLSFGAGRFPKANCQGDACEPMQALSRGIVPTLAPITPGLQVRVRVTEAADVGIRALIGGLDNNNQKVTELDGPLLVQGEFVTFAAPFADTSRSWNRIDGIQKGITQGPVSFYAYDSGTAVETLLITMEPGEKVASYQRYYLGGLPRNCCSGIDAAANTVQVTIMAKLDFIPCVVPTDYLLVQNREAIIAEVQALRYTTMDSQGSMLKSAERHRAAIRLLNGELSHFSGDEQIAVEFAPFGSAKLRHQSIGWLR